MDGLTFGQSWFGRPDFELEPLAVFTGTEWKWLLDCQGSDLFACAAHFRAKRYFYFEACARVDALGDAARYRRVADLAPSQVRHLLNPALRPEPPPRDLEPDEFWDWILSFVPGGLWASAVRALNECEEKISERATRAATRAAKRKARPLRISRKNGAALAESYALAERMQDILAQAHREAVIPEARRALALAGQLQRSMRDEIVRAVGVES